MEIQPRMKNILQRQLLADNTYFSPPFVKSHLSQQSKDQNKNVTSPQKFSSEYCHNRPDVGWLNLFVLVDFLLWETDERKARI